jgi:hypothetical protein
MSERRYDAVTLSRGVRLDRRGFAEVPAFVSRCGVLSYRRADGSTVRELRHPDDVFHADSLATLRGASVTIGHPSNGQEWVEPGNVAKHEVGVCAEPGKASGGKYVDAVLGVRRKDAIDGVQSKELVECSAAYDCKVIAESGVYEGQPYDQRQTNITYNHVALLKAGEGRAGRDVCLRADSSDAILVDVVTPDPDPMKHSAPPAPTKETPMAMVKKRVDGVEYELPETAASVFDKLVTERDSNKQRADKAETDLAKAKTDLATATDPKATTARITARVTLERQASTVLGEDKRFDSLTDREVREAVLKQTRPEYKVEGRSDDAITAAFDYAIEQGGGAGGEGSTNHGLKIVRSAIDKGDQQPKGGDKDKRADQRDLDKELSELERSHDNSWKPSAGAK